MTSCTFAFIFLFNLILPSSAFVALEDRGSNDFDLSYLAITLSNTTGSGIESDALVAIIHWGNHSYECSYSGATNPILPGSILYCRLNDTTTRSGPDNGFVDPEDSYRIQLDYGGYNTNSDLLRISSITACTNNGNLYQISSFCVPLHFNSSEMFIPTNNENDNSNPCSDRYPHKYHVEELTLDFFGVSAVRIDFNDQIHSYLASNSNSNQLTQVSSTSLLGNTKPLKPTSFIISFTDGDGAVNSDVDVQYTLYWDEDIIHCQGMDSSHSDNMVVCTTNEHQYVECDHTDSIFKLHITNPGIENSNDPLEESPISIDWISITLDTGSFKIENFCIDDSFQSVHDDDDSRNGSCSNSNHQFLSNTEEESTESLTCSKWTSVCVGDGVDSCNETSIDILFPLDLFTMNTEGNAYNLEGVVINAPDDIAITCSPTAFPTISPTPNPSNPPSLFPTSSPTTTPSMYPSKFPTNSPSVLPSGSPTVNPSVTTTGLMMAAPTTAFLHELDSMDYIYIDSHGPHGFGEWMKEHTFNVVIFTISILLFVAMTALIIYICYLKRIGCFKGIKINDHEHKIKMYEVDGVHADHQGDDSPVSGSFGSEEALNPKVKKSLSSTQHIEGPSRTGGHALHQLHAVNDVGHHHLNIGNNQSMSLAISKANSNSGNSGISGMIIHPQSGSIVDVHSEDEYLWTVHERPFGIELSSLIRDRHNLYVSKVEVDSIAARNGVSVGDKIVALNGTEVEGIGSVIVYQQIAESELPLTFTLRKQRGFGDVHIIQMQGMHHQHGMNGMNGLNQMSFGERSPAMGGLVGINGMAPLGMGMMMNAEILNDHDEDSMDSRSAEELFAPGTPMIADDEMNLMGNGNANEEEDGMRLSIIDEKSDIRSSLGDMNIDQVGLLIDANSNIETVGSLQSSHERVHSNPIKEAVGRLRQSISMSHASQQMKSISQESSSESEQENGMSEGDEPYCE